jgi:hypothetical protein
LNPGSYLSSRQTVEFLRVIRDKRPLGERNNPGSNSGAAERDEQGHHGNNHCRGRESGLSHQVPFVTVDVCIGSRLQAT